MRISEHRILDANFNRSREALRVMEEFARFVLDDSSLTQALKSARHDLTAALWRIRSAANTDSPTITAPEGPRNVATGGAQRNPWITDSGNVPAPVGAEETNLVLHRDIVNDVGATITTLTEAQRRNEIEVLSAACKRLTESLRALEEYGKILDPTFATTVEQLRYRGYELERRLFATLRAREKFATVRVYVLITESLCSGDWFKTALAALSGGADCIQLREKNLPDRELLERAKRLAQLCRDMEKIFIVNDRPDIAVAANAHGVHLGQDDLPVAAARRILPARMIVGLSTHTIEQVDEAIALAPDYIAIGPMFDSSTKSQPHIAGPALLAEARIRTALPLTAIGGIEQENIPTVLAAAPACICVCRAIIAQPDPAAAAKRLRALLPNH